MSVYALITAQKILVKLDGWGRVDQIQCLQYPAVVVTSLVVEQCVVY